MKHSIFSKLLAFALFFTTLGLSAETVRVLFVAGTASIQAPGEAAPRPIAKGDVVTLGTKINTGADGRVALSPAPGIQSVITPNSSLVLESSSEASASDSTVKHTVVLDLKQGAVVSDLNKPTGVSYDYSVRTPRGIAGARGTKYVTAVNSLGVESVIVFEGTVSATLGNGTVISITNGQASFQTPGAEPVLVNSVNELSPENKAIAKELVEISLTTLIAAGGSGASSALADILKAAEDLDILVAPAIKAQAELASGANTSSTNNNGPQTQVRPIPVVSDSEVPSNQTQ